MRHSIRNCFRMQSGVLRPNRTASLLGKERLRPATLVCMATLVCHHMRRNGEGQIRATVSLGHFILELVHTKENTIIIEHHTASRVFVERPPFVSFTALSTNFNAANHAPPPRQQSPKPSAQGSTSSSPWSVPRSTADVAN